MARRFATRIAAIRVNRFARIESHKNLYFQDVRAIRTSRLKRLSQTCDSLFLAPPRNAIRKKGVQFGNPETIRENQAIRANLRIDSRESGHLRNTPPLSFSGSQASVVYTLLS